MIFAVRDRGPVRRAGFVLAALLASACSREEPPAFVPPTQRTTIHMDGERATRALPDPTAPSWALQGTWSVHETRDAWNVALGEEVVVPVRVGGRVHVAGGAALALGPGDDVDDAFVEFEMRLRTRAGDARLALVRRTAHEASHGWTDLHVDVDVDLATEPRLVLLARAAKGPRPLASIARAHLERPRVVPAARADVPNVLVISVDTLRADHLGVYGYPRPTSPHVDALAKRGFRFETAISPAPWTLPAYGSLFTGLLPARHLAGVSVSREGNFADGRAVETGDLQFLSPDVVTIAQLLADRGYATAGFVSNPFLDAETGVDRGFAAWTQYVNRAQAGVELAQRWIEAQGETPWFLFLHLMDPHAPYTPPSPWDERFAHVSVGAMPGYPPSLASLRAGPVDEASKKMLVDLYDGEIAYTDSWIGELVEFLDARGLARRTLVVLHADHGEEFWDHGGYEHGHALHDEVLRVPLIFVLPEGRVSGAAPPGTVLTMRTSTVDVGPTILDVCRVDRPAELDGVSLLPHFLAGPASSSSADVAARDCVSEAMLYADHESKAISRGAEKLITTAGGATRLFDVGDDPRERRDLVAERPERVSELRDVLLARSRTILARGAAANPLQLSPERLRALAETGYAGEVLQKQRR